ncbi:MAG: hypothetical protein NC821_01035 [Candidatus Omnitrophica bacterium]|nr:hypothetical protein [Candidatus Omnitrophota bacterium]
MDELIYFSLFVDSAQLRSQKGNPEGLLRYLGTILFNFKLISKNTPLLSRAFKGLASTPGIEKTFIRLKDTTNGALRESMANEIIQIWEYLLTGDLSKINPGFPSIIISSPKDLNAKILYKNTNGEEIGAEIDVLFLTSTGETLAVEYKLYTRLEHKKTALELIQKYLELKVSQKQNPNHKVKIKLSDGKEEEINLDSVYFDLSFNPTDLSRFSWEDLKTALISLLNDPSQITDERERKRLERLLSLYGAISIDSFADDFIAWLRTRTALKNNLPEIFQYQILPSTQQIFDFNSAQSQEIRTIKREIPCSREYNFPRALLLVAAYLQRNPPPAPPVVVSLHNIKEEFGDLYHIKSILQLLEGSDPASFYQKPLSQQIAAFLKEINSP